MFNSDADMPKAEILTIGNEIISGLIQDANAEIISRRLQSIGVNVLRMASVGDDEKEINRALREAMQIADVVIVSGGLGPTHDDITKEVLARYFNSALAHDEKVYAMVEKFFSSRGKDIPEFALIQCQVPDKAVILYNEKGTAPGLLFKVDGKMVFSLPGIPSEMQYLLDEQVLPLLGGKSEVKIKHRILSTTGITESGLWEKIGSIDQFENKVVIATSTWLFTLAPILLLGTVPGLFQTLRRAGDLMWFAVLASVVGGLLIIPSTFFELAVIYEVATPYVER